MTTPIICGSGPGPCDLILYGNDNVLTEVPAPTPLPRTGPITPDLPMTAMASILLGFALVVAARFLPERSHRHGTNRVTVEVQHHDCQARPPA